ncbi:MAG: hypothetical protein ABEJ28_04390 [Salinigranum sp.]
MSREAANRLVQFLEERAGDYLRAAVHYTSDDSHVLYMREDVDALYSDSEMDDLFTYWRRRRGEQGQEPFSLGNLHCTVQFYDDALLFHFTQGETVGTVVALDPEAGRDIVSFITQCLSLLHSSSPQAIEHAPTWLQD